MQWDEIEVQARGLRGEPSGADPLRGVLSLDTAGPFPVVHENGVAREPGEDMKFILVGAFTCLKPCGEMQIQANRKCEKAESFRTWMSEDEEREDQPGDEPEPADEHGDLPQERDEGAGEADKRPRRPVYP